MSLSRLMLRLGWPGVAFALALTLGGCRCDSPGTPGSETARGQAAGKFPPDYFVWTGPEPRSVDPALVADAPGSYLALNLFEGLYVLGPGDSAPRPGVAERMVLSGDGLTVHFHLRADARWSDGTPVTADDFVFAWRRVLDPRLGSPGAHDLWRILNARAYNEGELDDPAEVGVRALDSRHLVVALEHPDPLLIHALAGSRFLPTPRHVVLEHGRRWTRPEHIVTNGHFRLTEWRPREHIVLARNDRHHAAETVALAGAVLRVTDSETLAARWFDRGEVHYTPGQVPFERLVAAAEGRREADTLRLDPLLGVAYLAFNHRRAPFDRIEVRRAFALAVDREALVRAALRGGQAPAGTFLPTRYASTIGYESPPGLTFNPSQARAELAAAGFPSGVGFPEITLVYNTSETMQRMMTVVASQLREHLGVRVRLEHQEWMSYLDRVRRGDFDLARFAMQGDYDPLELLEVFRAGGRNNIGDYTSARFDALLDAVRREGARDRRLRALNEAETVLLDDMAMLPLYFYTRPALLSPRVQGFEAQSRGAQLLCYLDLLPAERDHR